MTPSTPVRQPPFQLPHHRHAIAAALAEQFPSLRDDRDYLAELSDVAAGAVQADAAGRCIRWIRPHVFNAWRLVSIRLPVFPLKVNEERQQRECVRCGRIERDAIKRPAGTS